MARFFCSEILKRVQDDSNYLPNPLRRERVAALRQPSGSLLQGKGNLVRGGIRYFGHQVVATARVAERGNGRQVLRQVAGPHRLPHRVATVLRCAGEAGRPVVEQEEANLEARHVRDALAIPRLGPLLANEPHAEVQRGEYHQAGYDDADHGEATGFHGNSIPQNLHICCTIRAPH